MPGLVFRRRRLLLGGDELLVPYATSACGRSVWVLILAVGLGIATHVLLWGYCHNVGYVVFAYEFLSVAVGVLSLTVEYQIARASTYGTIIDPGPRNELLEKHLSRKANLGLAQLLLGLCGTVLFFYVPIAYSCSTDSTALVTTGLVLTTISQFLDCGGMYCCFLAFTSADSIWIDDDDPEGVMVAPRHGLLAEMEMKYEAFCRTACKWAAWCSCTFNVFGGGEQEADFAHVSRVFGRMLSARRYVDVVATDIAAGLILLRHVQKAADYKRREELRGVSAITTDPGLAGVSETSSSSGNTTTGGGGGGGGNPAPDSSSSESGSHRQEKDTAEVPPGQSGDAGGGSSNEGRSAKAAGGGGRGGGGGGGLGPERSERRERVKAGRVPLGERPKKHRKYYKVSRDEGVFDLTEGGEDCRVLQEVAHFIGYANVMYSVWGTLVIDPSGGLRRIIRRSGSWCPKFVTRRGAVHRESLFGASLGARSGSSLGLVSGSGSSGGAAVTEEDARERGRTRLPSAVPGLCEAEIRGDNWWGSHETALRAELPNGAELVLAHFNNCLDETPYCIAVDHTWQSIIITIRGSHSFEDFLVDAMAEPQSLESVGEKWGFDGSGMHAHEGILRRSEWIREDLETSGVLHLLLGTASEGDEFVLPTPAGSDGSTGFDGADMDGGGKGRGRRHLWKKGQSRRTKDGIRFSSLAPLASAIGGSGFCSGYTVRAVGHSLGGGVAALLALLLKPAYPTVRAIAVSPPGGLVSEGACREATEAMVTSIVLNDDVVPRMSAQSIEMLADQVLEVLGRSRVSKSFVMRSLLQTEESAHRPELYLHLEGGGGGGQAGDDEEHGVPIVGARRPSDVEQSAVPLVGRRKPSDAAAMGGAGAGGRGSRGSARVGGEDGAAEAGGGELRFHQQLRRYREHLLQERGSRRHLHRLRLPGRILHFVNTDFDTEEVPTTACEDGCLSCVCRSCPDILPSSRGGRDESEVGPCCCTPGVSQQRKRVFTPVWSSPTDLSEIKVTPAFLVDHSPEEILKAVEQTIRDLGVRA